MTRLTSLLASVLLLSALAFATACESSDGGDGTGGDGGVTEDTTGGEGDTTPGVDTPGGDDTGGPTCSCEGRECGAHPDSTNCAGISCGTCNQGFSCVLATGQCEPDVCSCGARVCGPHPDAASCPGVSCGTCTGEGEVCNASGSCEVCTPECGERECGLDPVCETSCGECTDGDICTEDGTCEPCVQECGARECGPDPECGESCGTCDAGWDCQAGTCVEQVEASPFGGLCLENANCHGEILATGEPATPTYPDCLDLLCETGECWGWWCTKACTPEKDEVNNLTGAPVPDGVEDSDSTSTQCAGAATDAFPGPFRCVNLQQPTPGTQPIGFCMPGSDFRVCDADADCPDGESCQIMQPQVVAGAVGSFCAQVPQNPVGLAAACNISPLDGEIAICESDLCLTVGCSAFCAEDTDCGTYDQGCDTASGTCGDDPQIACTTDADCSAWQCARDNRIFSNLDQTFDFCLGRDCFDNDDCRDSDFYCRLFGNFEDGMDPADFMWVPGCEGRPEGSVDVGEECDDDPEDDVEGPVCHSDFCISGYCSAFCTSDANCAVELGQRCVIYEWPLDLDDDGTDDHSEPIGLCYTIEGTDGDSPSCLSQADCPEGSTCSVFQAGDYSPGQGGETFMSGVCKPDREEDLDYLAACGLEDTQVCKGEGWLFQCFESNPDEGIPGYCSIPCRSSDECPDGTFFDDTEVVAVCESLYYGVNGTEEDQTDDLFISFCTPYAADTSKADCSADFTCEDANEACLPNQILGGPEDVPVVEWLCFEAFDEENPRPEAQPGDACTDGGDCASLYCVNETEEEDAGYCSEFCNSGEDCTVDGMECVQDVWFDRADDQYDLIVPNCQFPAEM